MPISKRQLDATMSNRLFSGALTSAPWLTPLCAHCIPGGVVRESGYGTLAGFCGTRIFLLREDAPPQGHIQYPTVKRWRVWDGLSSSSIMAMAKS